MNYVPSKFGIAAPHFVFYVEDQVKKMCAAGLFDAPNDLSCDKVVAQGGLRITTTLDLGLNNIGQKVIEDKLAANEAAYNGHNGALIAISPASGEILAYVGSRDFWRQDISGQVDIGTSLRSHGSTMKAFNYLAAFEQGWVPSTYVQDQPLILDIGGGQERAVNNWDGAYLGQITVRKAIAESVNTSAVRTVMDVGIDKMQEMAHRLGVTDLREQDCGPTITLGACNVKLVDMTYAFSVLANNGMMRGRPSSEDLPGGFRELDPVSVLKIQDAEGKTLYEYKAPQERPVLNSAYAYMLTDVLSKDAIKWSSLGIDRPAAVKTGTSEDFRDNVVMGYTPDLATGVWMGNTDNTPMAPGTFSSAGTGPIWKEFMLQAHHYLNLPPKNFEKPGNVVTVRCAGRDEPFEAGKKPPKAGLCAAPVPASAPAPERTEAAPESPTSEPSVSPTPKPRGTPTPTEPATPVETETLTPTPIATPAPGPGG